MTRVTPENGYVEEQLAALRRKHRRETLSGCLTMLFAGLVTLVMFAVVLGMAAVALRWAIS